MIIDNTILLVFSEPECECIDVSSSRVFEIIHWQCFSQQTSFKLCQLTDNIWGHFRQVTDEILLLYPARQERMIAKLANIMLVTVPHYIRLCIKSKGMNSPHIWVFQLLYKKEVLGCRGRGQGCARKMPGSQRLLILFRSMKQMYMKQGC